ncbi:hypothetical protein Tco_0032197 [Tanacetum coccineum]
MSSLAKNILAARAENRPPMLEKDGYDTWQSRMLLYVEGKEHGEMLLDSILNGSFEYKVVTFPANEAMGIPAETWMVKELMEGTELTKQEKESKLAYEFDRLHQRKERRFNHIT